ncbi:putative TRAPP trafficking subunit Trs65 [Lyophyllum shimeji]|uniref:TRAPP trafficking subunit Trs65 n=1 Tax=Lyophyllum shimeji TaxID=47721 RepID=A0A9P3UNU5_LYOSH|nr:putative TRAPP trafficking subunit Trs65 [Lyophyllum shimeji]
MSFDQLFATSVLNVVVPDTSVEYPPQRPADEWLGKLEESAVERKQAFFDEQLHSLLTLRIEHPTSTAPADADHPPQPLLTLLAHTQVSLEATYISSLPTPNPDLLRTSRLSAPPRTASLPKSNSRLQVQSHHPSILPPSTPNPTPSSADHDRRYVTSEGTLLLASIWGQNTSEDSKEGFSLLWSEKEQVWVAVYRLSLTVSFLRLNFSDPLLCLTVSATLRDKPLALAQPKHPLAVYFASVGSQVLAPPESPTSPNGLVVEPEGDGYDRLEEVNLLEGLLAGPTFVKASEKRLALPSTRLGTVSRQKLFSLPPVSLPALATPSPSPMTAVRTAHPTLRKSYRKTLQTVSGFRVRMRTVFVPYVLLPETERNADLDEVQEERERREAGNEERTVVLCVEVENSGESGPGIGFMIEKVDVSIGGEGARATLVGWGDGCFESNVEAKTFPLHIGAMAQYNLLYAVTFLRAPEEVEGFSLKSDPNNPEHFPNPGNSDLQRAVAINILGRPYVAPKPSSNAEEFSYPTTTFSSRWNCVLDLSAHQHHSLDTFDGAEEFTSSYHALPEPPSPFPASTTPRTAGLTSPNGGTYSAGSTPQSSVTAGSKRHTIPGGNIIAARSIKAATPNRAISMLSPGSISAREREQPPVPGASSRMSYIPPSISTQIPRSPTTYGAPPPPPLPMTVETNGNRSSGQLEAMPQPMTPAYPAYPPLSAVPPSPFSQGPIASHNTGNVGPSVEIRRERGVGMGGVLLPQTPGPWVTGGFGEQKMFPRLQHAERSGESIVVSVGLLPLTESARRKGSESQVFGPGKIYPLDYFTLDIFVFNQSEWTRRFEVTCPPRRRKRKPGEVEGYQGTTGVAKKSGFPGILPMDARVRIGPLRPSACQSVRMEFLAVTPGVHSIDALTLTDIESGFSMNLRSVMDIVVHDPST